MPTRCKSTSCKRRQAHKAQDHVVRPDAVLFRLESRILGESMGSWPNDTPLKVDHQEFAVIIPEKIRQEGEKKDNKGVM